MNRKTYANLNESELQTEARKALYKSVIFRDMQFIFIGVLIMFYIWFVMQLVANGSTVKAVLSAAVIVISICTTIARIYYRKRHKKMMLEQMLRD